MSDQPTPEEARALLDQAEQAASTTRAGASWPQIAGLLGLGGASSLAIPAFAYTPEHLVALPMVLVFVWIGAVLVFSAVFGRSLKHGFGKRWVISIMLWGITWVLSILGIYWWFPGQAWFVALASTLLAAITLGAAWAEARR